MRFVARIAEPRHPIVRVIHRVIDAIGAVEPDPARRNAEVMIETGKIRSAAQIPERQGRRVPLMRLEPHVVHGTRSHRIGNDPRGGAKERLERWRSSTAERRPGERAVFVDVRDDVRAQGIFELLHPLGRANEAPFLCIPRAEDERPRRPQSLAGERSERSCGFEHGHRSTHVVTRARSPGISMAADHHPLIGPPCAANHSNGIPDLVETTRPALGFHSQPRAHRAWSDVIPERQRTFPRLRHRRPFQGLEQPAGIAVAHRNDGNAGNVE